MKKAAIFDVDGTLLDSMAIWEEVGARYLKRLGIQTEENLGRTLYAMTVPEAAGYLKETYALPLGKEQVAEGLRDTLRQYYYEEAPLKKGVKEVLEFLNRQGIPMVIASSSEKDHIEAAFRRLSIDSYFRKIYTCTEVGEGKGSPRIFQMAAHALGVEPADIWVFEDALYALETAKKAGFFTVGIYDRFSDGAKEEIQQKADLYVEDWAQFMTYMKAEKLH